MPQQSVAGGCHTSRLLEDAIASCGSANAEDSHHQDQDLLTLRMLGITLHHAHAHVRACARTVHLQLGFVKDPLRIFRCVSFTTGERSRINSIS